MSIGFAKNWHVVSNWNPIVNYDIDPLSIFTDSNTVYAYIVRFLVIFHEKFLNPLRLLGQG